MADRVSGRLVVPAWPVIADSEHLLTLLQNHAATDHPDKARAARLAAGVAAAFPPYCPATR